MEWLAEELTADVFYKMLEAIRAGNGWKSSFTGWLYRIAHNRIIDYYRERARRESVSIEDVVYIPDTGDSADPHKQAVEGMEATGGYPLN
jgi:DNA-directed RNA polymerase specialized sigma24 family protein